MLGHRAINKSGQRNLLYALGVLSLVGGTASALRAQDQQPSEAPASGPAMATIETGGLKTSGAFPFDYQHLAFRRGVDGSVEVWAAVSVHAGRVRGVPDDGWKYDLGMRFDLLRDGLIVATGSRRVVHRLNREVPEEMSDGFPLQASVRVPPGEYTYRLEVIDYNWAEGRSTNVQTGRLTVPRFASDLTRPVLSSIAIAADSGGTWQPEPDVALKLNAARIVRKESQPYLYFEVYGLTPGEEYRGEVKFRSIPTSRDDGVAREAHQPLQVQYRKKAPDDPSTPARATLKLDIRNARPGSYEVTVRIVDLATGATSTVARTELEVQELDEQLQVFPSIRSVAWLPTPLSE